eukprot:3936277-Rhodomonas_salina.3
MSGTDAVLPGRGVPERGQELTDQLVAAHESSAGLVSASLPRAWPLNDSWCMTCFRGEGRRATEPA